MESQTGLFAIEGSDGCGKQTQSRLLIERLQDLGKNVINFEFPRYDNDSSIFVRRYLAGEYGDLDEVDCYQASLLFALDRYDAKFAINEALRQQNIVVTDRFVASNLAHQGSKIENSWARQDFYAWCNQLEFSILKIPQPDLNIVLNIDPQTSQQLLKDKQSSDIHEQDDQHQIKSRQIYAELCSTFPKKFTYINCSNDTGQLATPESIHDQIWHNIQPLIEADD